MPATLHDLLRVSIESIEQILQPNTIGLSIVAGYVIFNLVLFACTKGKEFAFAGYTGALFLIPFIKFG